MRLPRGGLPTADLGAALAADGGCVDLLWELLSGACRELSAAWRTPVLATAGAAGGARARTVVLRGAQAMFRRLELHSDRRAGKISEIVTDPRVALCFWDGEAALQLRAEGVARLTPTAVNLAAWARVPERSRDNYRHVTAPGSRLGEGAGTMAGDGRENFVAIEVEVHRLDWLLLAKTGHLRGEAVWTGGAWNQHRLAP